MIEHSERQHALLSPSAAHRWMECTPSARLCECYPEETSEYAQQGTDAHELCQYKVENALGLEPDDPRENLQYLDDDMEKYTSQYAMYVMATAKRMNSGRVLIESQIDFSRWVQDGFGHCDCLIIAEHEIRVIDFKYGSGVRVDATRNPQMMCYALGALNLLGDSSGIETVSMEIFQPRMHSISTYSLPVTELLNWAENELKPKADMAYNGDGELHAGAHCRFCKAKKNCEEYKKYDRKND